MAYDYNWFPAWSANLFRRECAAANRADAENRKEIVGDELTRNLFHFGRGGLISQQEFLVGAGHQAGEDLRLFAKEEIVGEGKSPIIPRRVVVQPDYRVWVLDW